jgi:hypothetical protein
VSFFISQKGIEKVENWDFLDSGEIMGELGCCSLLVAFESCIVHGCLYSTLCDAEANAAHAMRASDLRNTK